MNYIAEIRKQWRMGLSQSCLWHLKSGQYADNDSGCYTGPIGWNKLLWAVKVNTFNLIL